MNSAQANAMASPLPVLIQKHLTSWNLSQGLKEEKILRLVILRDIVHALHAEKSKMLALGQRADADNLGFWELKIDTLASSPSLEGELADVLSKEHSLPKSVKCPPEIFSILPREKLERQDRHWEAAMACEAFAQAWSLWRVEAWVEVSSVEAWQKHLVEKLWPQAIVLFAEAATKSPSGKTNSHPGLWKGRWTLFAALNCNVSKSLNPGDSTWPGAPAHPPTPLEILRT